MYLLPEYKLRIKSTGLISILILTIFFLSYCEEETARSRSYPRLSAISVSNITERGVIFGAEISSMGSEEIIQHGFIWGTSSYLSLTYNDRIWLGSTLNSNAFSAEIFTTLVKNQKYYVRAFVQTSEHIVYGTFTEFVSLGSEAPQIFDFEPQSAAWSDTITIKGKNFSWVGADNKVKLNEKECTVVNSTDSTVRAIVNNTISDLNSTLSVTLAGNVTSYNTKSFILVPPVLKDFYPRQGRWGDTLFIKGRSLRFVSYTSVSSLKLGSQTCYVHGIINDSVLYIKIPYELNAQSSELKFTINGFVLQHPQTFELLPPEFTIAPKQGTWGNTITLNGKFNTIFSRNAIFFDDVQATIVTTSPNILKVQVPPSVSKFKSNIIYKCSPFNVASPDTFLLFSPIIKTISPISGAGGTTVTIQGKYYSPGNTTVNFGSVSGNITSMNDSIIIVKVPSGGVSGLVKISVKAFQQQVFSSTDFVAINPAITNFSPQTGTFNDQITITGANFIPQTGSTTVTFNGIQADVVTLTENSIKVKVPLTLDSIPRNLIVTAGTNYATSSDKFTLIPPQIISISPETMVQGQDFTISGINFNPAAANNKVFWDIYPLTVKSSSATSIVATIPLSVARGTSKITVSTGGYLRASTQEFSINSQWLRIPCPELKTSENSRYQNPIAGKGLKDYGYLCSTFDKGLTYKFNPVNFSWTKIEVNAPVQINSVNNLNEVVCKDTFYIVYGNSPVMLGFDQVSEKWKQKTITLDYSENAVAFSINSKIYFGMNHPYYQPNIFYEIDPSGNYSKSKLPNTLSVYAGVTAYFTLNNKGYVLYSNNSLWRFDSESLTWTRLPDFPGKARYAAVSFVLGDFAYMGTGTPIDDFSKVYSDIWKFDPLTNSWTNISSIPVPRQYAVSLTINGKAYIGYGRNYWDNLFDFYEFDPNYPLK